MENHFKILLSIVVVFLLYGYGISDGKLLRGEKWNKYTVEGKKADFYVSPNGNDQWSGTLPKVNQSSTDGPFATIARAKEAVRELKKSVYNAKEESIDKRFIPSPHKYGYGKDILILLRGGHYQLEEPLLFTPDDGGERIETGLPSGAFEFHKLKDHYVTYAAYPGEKPILLGGKIIKNWDKKGKIWVARLDRGKINKLYANGRFQTLARTPDKGYYTVAEPPTSTEFFKYKDDNLRNWSDMGQNRIVMLLRWHIGINSIVKVDEAKNFVYLSEPQLGIRVVSPRYYVENIKALLNMPGEWYYDESARELSFIPPEELRNSSHLAIVAPSLSKIIDITGTRTNPVRNLRFYGLNIGAVDENDNAIAMEYAHNCEVVDSDIRAVGGKAIYISKGCYQTRILNNKIKYAEKGAISIIGIASPKNWGNDYNAALVEKQNDADKQPCKRTWQDLLMKTVVSYNQIDSCGGTSLHASNCLFITISHNEVSHNLGRYSIYVGGWSNIEESVDAGYTVEYNHVHHAQTKADDSGAITTGGMTHNSVVRNNLIHDVQKGFFNNNVAFWFDNMSSGWRTENNIYYNLEQGDMKLCACNLVDNEYLQNYWIEAPKNPPEGIINGEPEFVLSNFKIKNMLTNNSNAYNTGDQISITADAFNRGSTGINEIELYVDGRIAKIKSIAVIQNNSREISFTYRFFEPGIHQLAIGDLPYIKIDVKGEKRTMFVDSLNLSSTILPLGEKITIWALVFNKESHDKNMRIPLKIDGREIESKNILVNGQSSKKIDFTFKPQAGKFRISVGNSVQKDLLVYKHHLLNVQDTEFAKYCAPRAEPCTLTYDQKKNYFKIRTAGADFFHGEDAYSTIYIKKPIKGNFIATVKVMGFGPKTTEWFRTGLFMRNDITRSFENGEGSLGSVLLFSTPRRAGINWDEYGNGCTHSANSENLDPNVKFPIWLKLVRHGNSISGYVSYDGKNWVISRHTKDIPGIAEAVHLGLAAGSDNMNIYEVEFEELKVDVEVE